MPPRNPSIEAPHTEESAAVVFTKSSTNPAPAVAIGADELIEMDARAEAARARALELRRQAEAASRPPARRWRPHRPGRKALIAAVAALIGCAALAGSGSLLWQHHRVEQRNQRAAEFEATARDAVVAMMSIDPKKARADMQRFADATTGQFKVGVLMGGDDMIQAIEQSNANIKAAVQAVGVQSMTEDSAVVLVAARSELVKPDQPTPEIRNWRLVVDVATDAGKFKVSKIEFVP